LDELDEREQRIIVSRFGIGRSGEPLTLNEVGDEIGVTKERVRQIESRALAKLRKVAEDEQLDIPGL
jgi:RNA polymerase sigma factor (sigma-70 family)